MNAIAVIIIEDKHICIACRAFGWKAVSLICEDLVSGGDESCILVVCAWAKGWWFNCQWYMCWQLCIGIGGCCDGNGNICRR